MAGAASRSQCMDGSQKIHFESAENRKWRGEKESNFFHCRDRRHRRSFALSPFSSFASFRMRRCEQIKDERAEPNSFGVTVERGRGNKAREGPFPSTLARRASHSEEWRGGGDSAPKSEFKGKWKLCENRWHARECEVTLCAGFHLPQLTSSRLDSRGAGTRGEFVQLSF